MNNPIYELGAKSRREGYARRFNLYAPGSELWKQWDAGWVDENAKLIGNLPRDKQLKELRRLV